MRQTSEVNDTDFPFAEDTTTFALVYNFTDDQREEHSGVKGSDRGFDHAWTVDKKTELIERAKGLHAAGVECSVTATWLGGNHTDTFLVDDLDEALAALRI